MSGQRIHIFALSFICGFCIALFGIASKASEQSGSLNPINPDTAMTLAAAEPATITIDVNNMAQDINYQEVDKFIETQQPNKPKFAAVDNGVLILSEEPIILTKPYSPTALSDLGWRFNAKHSMTKMPAYSVIANKQLLRTPAVPPMVVVLPSPIQTLVSAKTVAGNIVHTSTAHWADFSWLTSAILAVTSLLILGLVLVFRLRQTTSPMPNAVYIGEVASASEMTGKGKFFDFNGDLLRGKVQPINSTYLNMMWHLGRLSQDSAVDTYFYMAFYIPPQQEYAKQLRERKAKETTPA